MDHVNDGHAHDPDVLDPTGVLAELGRRLQSPRSFEAAMNDVVGLACQRIEGCDAVSITLIDDGPGTIASTSGFATELDERQDEAGWGPCLAAAEYGQTIGVDDVTEETAWPEFIRSAGSIGLGSSLSVPVPFQQHIGGALNFYATRPHAFDRDSQQLAEAFAAHAALALAQAFNLTHATSQAATLQEAMRSRAVIEQAKGIYMAARQCTADEAFDILIHLSQTSHRKLRDVAAEVVSRASSHPVDALEPS